MNQTNDTNKRIAEKCGIKPEPYFRRIVWIYDGVMHESPPNYDGDLNWMHKAEKTLTEDQRRLFARKILAYCGADREEDYNFAIIHATAAQRAAAFLAVVEGMGE